MALYLVATPIGNLEDITLRAIRVLREARLIASEDTRTTQKLLNHYEIRTPIVSYFEHSSVSRLEHILREAEEADVALVSEAGMPGLSDPGFEVVRAAVARNIRVIPVPGANAVISALVASGLASDRFLFLGFLPRRAADRRRLLAVTAREPHTLVFFESPHRLVASLSDMALLLGNRRVAIARELTKVYEEIYRGTIEDALAHFFQPRGEFTLVVEGYLETPVLAGEKQVTEALSRAVGRGLSRRDAITQVASELGLNKREVYRVATSSLGPGDGE